MRALKSAGFVVAAQVSKILVGLVLIKLAAIYVGVEGFGQLGHLMSLVTMMTLLAGGGIVNGLIKYTSEYRNNIRDVLEFASASATYSLFVSGALFIVLVVFAKDIAGFVFSTPGFEWVIRLLAASQLCIAFSNLVTGIANGYKNTKVFATVQIVGNVLSILVIWWLISSFAYMGAAVSIAISYAFMAVPAFFFFYKSRFWGRIRLGLYFKEPHFKRLFGFTLMLVVSATTFPFTEMYIREMIINGSGFSDAGLWQALIKLSSVYIGFFGLFLSYYFIPTVSPMQSGTEISKTTFKYLVVASGLFLVGALALVLASGIILPLLLSDDFLVLEDFLIYQLVGDVFKISAFVIGFVFVAKAAVKVYIVAELFQNALFIMLASLFYTESHNLGSIMDAYIVTYVVYFVVSLIVFFIFLKKRWLASGM